MSDAAPSAVESTPGIRLSDVEVPLHFDLGDSTATIGDLETMQAGYVFALPRLLTDAVTISVNGAEVARGELVRIGDRLGVRVVEVLSHASDDA